MARKKQPAYPEKVLAKIAARGPRRGPRMATVRELRERHSIDLGNLHFLKRAILAGDPTSELILRIDDMIRGKTQLMNKGT